MLQIRTLLLLVLVCATTMLSAQLPDSCAAPKLVRQHYLNSAKIIALRQMLGDPNWADSVRIPAVLYNPVLDALSAVYNATQVPERDTVTDCLNIQAFPGPIYPKGISLLVDTTLTWAKKLHQGIMPTGNTLVDELLQRYNLKLTGSFQFDQFVFFFQSGDLLNTAALAALFNAIPGVQADPDSSIGGGADITLDTVAGGVTLTYSIGWGDCPAGCIYERRWTFLVTPDCSVQFLGAEGDALTAEVPCSAIFACATEPLCLPWLRDSIQHYLDQVGNCQQTQPKIHVTLYEDIASQPVIGIHVFIGPDAANSDFFYCDGAFIGRCSITIAGFGCSSGNLIDYFEGDTIWNCNQPLPSLAECGLNAAPVPNAAGLAFQLSPNPTTTGQVLLEADFEGFTQGRLQVLDIFGKVMLEKKFAATQLVETLDLPGQSPGLYLVRLDVDGQVVTRKLLLLKP